MRKAVLILAGLAAMLALTACEIGDAELTLTGPDSAERNDFVFFDAEVTGLTPLLAFVYFDSFVDLDNDNYPDENETLQLTYVGADRLGYAYHEFYLVPSSFYEARSLSVPSTIPVKVRAQIHWSDPTDGIEVLTESHNLTITD